MHRFKVLLALVLGVLIVWWLVVRFRDYPERTLAVDPLDPIREKIALLSSKFGLQKKQSVWEVAGGIDVPTTDAYGPQINANLHPEFVVWSSNLSELEHYIQRSRWQWSEDATILLLQRCDFGSQYCVEGYESWEIFKYMEVFPEILAYQLMSYPRNNDALVLNQHYAVACVRDLVDHETYLDYYFTLYQSRGLLTKEELITLAKNLSIDGFQECLSTKNPSDLQNEMKQSRETFGFNTLPANVFINLRTGRWVLVPWLYETNDVLAVIEWLKNN